jgi:hypothetical protein
VISDLLSQFSGNSYWKQGVFGYAETRSNEREEMKKKVFAVFIGAVVGASVISVPANAAISNGASCSKAGATTKVGSKSYKCAKNPFVSPTKNTWTLTGCLTAYALWKDAKQQYADWKDIAMLAGPEGEKTLADLQKSITSLESTMKTKACKKGA